MLDDGHIVCVVLTGFLPRFPIQTMAPLRLAAGLVALIALIVIRRRERLRLKALMPPGPKLAWFGLGDNKGDMPKHEAWKTFSKWHEQYG
jgi:hypothetical protein